MLTATLTTSPTLRRQATAAGTLPAASSSPLRLPRASQVRPVTGWGGRTHPRALRREAPPLAAELVGLAAAAAISASPMLAPSLRGCSSRARWVRGPGRPSPLRRLRSSRPPARHRGILRPSTCHTLPPPPQKKNLQVLGATQGAARSPRLAGRSLRPLKVRGRRVLPPPRCQIGPS